ncbi:hypothetical protein XarCFBP6771_09645 [Xanthomonas arboricola]|nr:hypothetical protein XarCFBP6771_09645 [Xanthomonas arboricola]
MQRVPRWWAGKDPAAKPQIIRSTSGLSAQPKDTRQPISGLVALLGCDKKAELLEGMTRCAAGPPLSATCSAARCCDRRRAVATLRLRIYTRPGRW